MHRRLRAAALVPIVTLSLAACGGQPGASDPGADSRILVWTLESQPDRMAKQKAIVAKFTAKTQTQVELVGIDEAQFPQLIASAAQSGNMPDVVGSLGLSSVWQMDGQQLVDRDAAAGVLDKLGKDTFAPGALELTADKGQPLSVPSDSWAQMLVYRKDLFAKAGLEAPDTYDKLRNAAKALTKGSDFGITLATDPGDPFTMQTFESLALGNDCQLITESGDVTLGDAKCRATWELYGELATQYSPQGKQDVDTTRAAYFSGNAAMVFWSAYLLDEMAGLRNDALPTCDECASDAAYLAKNSGIVTLIKGPDGEGSSLGEFASWVVTEGGEKTEPAKTFVEFMLTDGYVDWLSVAPEGKFPARNGPTAGSTAYVDRWADLPAGVDRREPLSTFYSADVIANLKKAAVTADRWALKQGQGRVLGSVSAELPVSKAVASLGSGTSPQEAMTVATEAVAEIAKGVQ